MEWAELVRWHCQHQRIGEERAHLAQITSQMATLSAIAGASATPTQQLLEEDVGGGI